MTDLYVFDFHGTLSKGNENAVVESTNLSLEKHRRRERLTVEDAKRLQGRPWADYFRELCPDASDEQIASMVEYARTFDSYVIPKYVKPMDNVSEVLTEIKGRGHAAIVISNTTPEVLDIYLKCVGIESLVDDKLGIARQDEKSGKLDVTYYKAKKLREYLKNKKFGRIVLVGDTEDDINAGKLIGAITLYFNPNGKKYDTADQSISDLRQLLTIF